MPAIDLFDDVMSRVLALVRMRGELLCVSELGAPWGLRFHRHVAHFHVVEQGSCLLKVEGHRDPIHLAVGDLVVVPLGAGHAMLDRPRSRITPIDEAVEKSRAREKRIMRFGGGGEQTRLLCGQFSLEGAMSRTLLAVLPPVIHVKADGRLPNWLDLTARFLIDEMVNPSPGSAITISRLIDLLFVCALRQWGAERPSNVAWLSGLSDPRIGRVLSALHREPGRDWTVAELAGVARMSRSAFAQRFLRVVGQTPLRYLAEWRLNAAADLLRVRHDTIAQIARHVGYESEAAFTRAFKARFGRVPSVYRVARE